MSRELIDVQFTDNNNFVDTITDDVLGSVISASWGPREKLQKVNLTQFLSLYPSDGNPHESWIRVKRAFDAGIGEAEVYRVADGYLYTGATLVESSAESTLSARVDNGEVDVELPAEEEGTATKTYSLSAVTAAVIEKPEILTVYSKYPGNFPVENPILTVVGTVQDEEPVIGFALYNGTTLVEMMEGTLNYGQIVDGQNVFIGDVMQSSQYLSFEIKDYQALKEIIKSNDLNLSLTVTAQNPTAEENLLQTVAALYPAWFKDFTISSATILVPWSNDADVVTAVINTAEAACDRVAIVGYPTTELFDVESITTKYQTLTKAMFSAFYAAREVVNVGVNQVPTDGIGAIAGRIAAVADSDSVNQLPSSYSYGSFPGTLLKSVTFSDAIAFQADGINTVISSTEGPMIYGIKSMYSRQSSYFAKFNCMRVIARILQSTFPLLMSVHHTPNTTRKRAAIQTDGQSYLQTLIAQEALDNTSTAICNDTNNNAVDTLGGEILILDFNLGFVNLIQRFIVHVTANEAGVTANVTVQ